MTTVIVGGALANKPRNGGEAWVRLSWVRALEELGFEVLLAEEIAPDALVDAGGRPVPPGESVNVAYFDHVVRAFGLEGRAALLDPQGRWMHGLSRRRFLERARDAELLVNIGGHLTVHEVKERVRTRAYVDIDPGFVHFWEAAGISGARLEGHDHYFTIGERIGREGCPVPTLGLTWHPVRQPVTLADWPVEPNGSPDRFTTVASWRGAYGPVHFGGRTFGLKVHEFRRFIELPGRAPGRFELALAIHPGDRADLERLRRNGWTVVDPLEAAGCPQAFRRYVQGSGGEFSVAQGIYVEARCGWFSDRSTRYLASGKPVVVQDTGLEGLLPVGEGLLVFGTVEEARDAVERVLADYDAHSRAARNVARECFAPERALERLLDVTGVTP